MNDNSYIGTSGLTMYVGQYPILSAYCGWDRIFPTGGTDCQYIVAYTSNTILNSGATLDYIEYFEADGSKHTPSTTYSFTGPKVAKWRIYPAYVSQDGLSDMCRGLDVTGVTANTNLILTGQFRGCTSLRDADLGQANIVFDYGFYNCSGLTLNLSNIVIYGARAFANCRGVNADFTGCIWIGEHAFTNSGINGNVDLDGLVVWGNRSFSNCTGITSVTLSNVNSIPEGSFYLCSNLTTVTIPDSVTVIHDSAFDSAGLTGLTLPSGITRIGRYAFSGCPISNAITLPDTLENLDVAAFDGTAVSGLTIGTGLTTIQGFANCTGLTGTLTIPDNIEIIENVAFENTSINTLELGTGLTKIGFHSFSGCSNLTAIYVDTTNKVASDYPTTGISSPFYGVPASGTLYYHIGTDISLFQSALPTTWTFTTF